MSFNPQDPDLDDLDFDLGLSDAELSLPPSSNSTKRAEPSRGKPIAPDELDFSLCSTCTSLDIVRVLESTDDNVTHDVQTRYLGTITFPQSDEDLICSLCRLFCRVRLRDPSRDSSGSYKILQTYYQEIATMVSTLAGGAGLDRCIVVLPLDISLAAMIRTAQWQEFDYDISANFLDCIMLQEAQDHNARFKSLSAPMSSCIPRPVNANSIDWDVIRAWFSDLPEDDLVVKKAGMSRTRYRAVRQRALDARGTRMIDCLTKTIVAWQPDTQFLALSYVWGEQEKPHGSTSWRPIEGAALPSEIPRVLHDAMIVTIALGYRFLWVDKYCIDQRNAIHKLSQIYSMDLIYQTAVATIIAAAGEDENYGLPGVSIRSRTAGSQGLALANGHLTSVIHRPEPHIAKSRWASRGWTYQEGVLARRKLVFTDAQIYFECQGWVAGQIESIESFTVPLNHQLALSQSRLGYFINGCDNNADFQPSKLQDLGELGAIWKHIAAYNLRDLRFESDRLQAFRGILACSCTHLYGLPVKLDILDSIRDEICLAWTHGHEHAPKRRPGFPSFSWTGWSGDCEWKRTGRPDASLYRIGNMTRQSSPEGEIETLPHHMLRVRAEVTDFVYKYHETGPLLKKNFFGHGEVEIPSLYLSGGITAGAGIEFVELDLPGLDRNDLPSDNELRCIWLEAKRQEDIAMGILAKPIGENNFERVGYLRVRPSILAKRHSITLALEARSSWNVGCTPSHITRLV